MMSVYCLVAGKWTYVCVCSFYSRLLLQTQTKSKNAQRAREGDTYWILFDLRCLNWNPQPFWLVVRCGQIIRNSVTILLKCLTTANNIVNWQNIHTIKVHSNDRFNLVPWFFSLLSLSPSFSFSVSLVRCEWSWGDDFEWTMNEPIRMWIEKECRCVVEQKPNNRWMGLFTFKITMNKCMACTHIRTHTHTDRTNSNAQILSLDRRHRNTWAERILIWWDR